MAYLNFLPVGKLRIKFPRRCQACRRWGGGGGSRGLNRPPLQVNDGGLKTQAVNFQFVANGGGMENKL